MTATFFEKPILNSPYGYPARHWELDKDGQPTNRITENRRRAELLTPIPKAKKRRATANQAEIIFNEGAGISTAAQQYDPNPIINLLRRSVDQWREIKNPSDWQVTPETARLLQHWRSHKFSGVRPFFCQVEAAEAAIWLTEVAPQAGKEGRVSLDYVHAANEASSPGFARPKIQQTPLERPVLDQLVGTVHKAVGSDRPNRALPRHVRQAR